MLERDYKRFRSFNKIYWVLAIIITVVASIASIALIGLAITGYADAKANSDLTIVVFIFIALIGIILTMFIIMILTLITSLPYVIFNGIHLYKFHKANIRFDIHMVYALVMTIIMGYFDIMTIISLSTNLLSVILNATM